MRLLNQNIGDAMAVFGLLDSLGHPLEQAVTVVEQSLRGGHKLLIAGNGGSATDASHLATEFVCRFKHDRDPLPAIAFNDASTLTAVSNDYAFDRVFERQVRAFGRPGDVLIVLSTSGRSENVRAALEASRDLGLASVALLGRDGGACAGMASVELIVPCDDTARVQEAHTLLYHTLCEAVESALFE